MALTQVQGAMVGPTGFANLSGITFPATQVPSADANTLDDYEEGTFTPNLAFGGASVGMSYTRQVGSYTKVGRYVYFSIEIILSNKGSSTGSVTVTNLPFLCVGSNGYNGGANDVYNANMSFWTASAHCIFTGTNVVSIQQVGASGTGFYNNGNFNNNSSLYIHGSYQAA